MVEPKKSLKGLALKDRVYHSALPAELLPFYCYPIDCGHSILVLPMALRDKEGPVENWLVPAPVKTVLSRGWEMVRGAPCVDIECDPQLGLIVPAEDEEW